MPRGCVIARAGAHVDPGTCDHRATDSGSVVEGAMSDQVEPDGPMRPQDKPDGHLIRSSAIANHSAGW